MRTAPNRVPDLVYPPERRGSSSGLSPWLLRIPLLMITAVIMLAFLGVTLLAFHQLQYEGKVFPGVSAYGVDLSGMTREQAFAALSQQYTYGKSAIFTFRDGDKVWQKTADELGVRFDPNQTIDQAFKVGREGTILTKLQSQGQSWLNGSAIQPTVYYDQSAAAGFLNLIAKEIDQTVQDATIVIQGTQVITGKAQVGRALDVSATLGLVRQTVMNMTTGAEIRLIMRETAPSITDAEEVGNKLRVALASPIEFYVTDAEKIKAGPWTATPEFLAGLYTILRVEDGATDGVTRAHYELKFNPEPLRGFLLGLAPELAVDAQPARFLFNDTSNQLELIKDSISGRAVNVDRTMLGFNEVLYQTGTRRIPLIFEEQTPTVNSASTAASLGITENIVTATTFFYGSTLERRTNIQVAAARFHGLIIAPGEVFSFNKYLGDVSPETGYETGLVIFGDKTIAGVGGGVCQASSTIFQAAFFSGFPIVERYAHGYRVGYYESGTTIANGRKYDSGVGLDATVYAPEIDFKFRNDTPYHILIETYYEPKKQSLTVKFYSTTTGRIVEKDGPEMSNYVAHGKPKYTEDKDVRPGQTRQIDYAVDGVDVRVYRTITLDGSVVTAKEEVYSHYLPWSAQFLVAPGYAPKN